MTLAAGPPTILGGAPVPLPPTICGVIPPPLEVDPPDEELVDDPLPPLLPPPEGGTNGLGSPYRPDCRRTGNATALPTRAKSIKQNAINDFFILFFVLHGSTSTQHQCNNRSVGIYHMRSVPFKSDTGVTRVRSFPRKNGSLCAPRDSAPRRSGWGVSVSALRGQHGGHVSALGVASTAPAKIVTVHVAPYGWRGCCGRRGIDDSFSAATTPPPSCIHRML